MTPTTLPLWRRAVCAVLYAVCWLSNRISAVSRAIGFSAATLYADIKYPQLPEDR